MTDDDVPLWKRMFDAFEQAAGPQLEQYVRTEQFADLAASAARFQTEMQRRTAEAMGQALHAWNIPSASDVQRLSEQVASLERRVRELSRQIEMTRSADGERNG